MEPELPSSENDVLTGDEASEFLGIPKPRLLDLCRDGQLAGIKVGRHWRFHRDALEARRDWDSTLPQPNLSEPPSQEAIPTPSQEPTTENDMKSTTLESLLKAEQLEHLLPIFEEQGVTDSILGELTDSDLRELGIEKFGERKRLLRVFNQPMESPAAPPGKPASKPKRTASPQEDFTYDAANGEIIITGYRGRGHVVIPDKFDDLPLPVRRIGDGAFKDNGMVLSVVIPMGVTTIGNGAFSGCSSMASVEIPDGVTSIGGGVFEGCTNLSNLNIPKSMSSIGERTFLNAIGLTSITIPNSVTLIGGEAFYGCTGLTSITIPNSVTSIGYSAFKDCTGLTSITIPNSVTSIENSVSTIRGESRRFAFEGCQPAVINGYEQWKTRREAMTQKAIKENQPNKFRWFSKSTPPTV